ncbi:MAG: arylsulfatase [Novosphingobium sp.]|nr:arylsulfatase [Novosphingobium sp.]
MGSTAAAAAPTARGPSAYPGFKGEIGRTALESKPWWPPEKRAPDKAPNIIVLMCDDLGFADLGCFGAEIDTPNIDKLASEGVRYTNYHSEPTCSPTRAALLTGINPHAVGYGVPSVPGGADPGFPGYSWQLADDAATSAEILKDAGYATLAVGKWHLSRPIDTHEFTSTTSWPTKRGFDRYYGEWGCPNLHQPGEIWSDNHIVQTDQYPDDYFYTDDLTDNAISMIRSVRQGDPDKPFYLYLALSSPHAPMNAKKQDMMKYRGRFDEGWDKIRQARFERQKELGITAPDTRLPARNTDPGWVAEPWDELSDRERDLQARYMECYAALVDNIDQCFGRLRQAVEQMGEWDNTIVVFTSDNGANREGALTGSTQYGDLIFRVMQERANYQAAGGDQLELDYKYYKDDEIGGPQTQPDYAYGWAMAGNTPFRYYKSSTYAGGHQVPFIISWPKGVAANGGIRSEYVHVTDILPTILDLTGLEHPREMDGRKLQEMTGVSFAHTLHDAKAKSHHREQYTESTGSRRYYRDGWALVTLHQPMHPIDDSEWHLYNLMDDPTEIDDLAAKYPDKVREMSEAWERAAWKNKVFPLNEGSGVIFMSRAPYEERYAQPLTLYQDSPTVPAWRARWLMEGRSFTVRNAFAYAPGDAGTLFKHGGQGGGYGLYVEDGRLLFVLNGYGRMTELQSGQLSSGNHEVSIAINALRGWRWDIELHVDGKLAASSENLPMLAMLAPIGGIDVGIDRRSPISWRLYQENGAFPYTGKIATVRYEPGEWAPDMAPHWADEMRQRARQAQ